MSLNHTRASSRLLVDCPATLHLTDTENAAHVTHYKRPNGTLGRVAYGGGRLLAGLTPPQKRGCASDVLL